MVCNRGLLSCVRRIEEVEDGEEGEVIAVDPVVATGFPGTRNVAERVT